MDKFLQHTIRFRDFAREVGNHRLDQLLRTPHSVAAQVHRCLKSAEGDSSPPPRARARTSWPPPAS